MLYTGYSRKDQVVFRSYKGNEAENETKVFKKEGITDKEWIQFGRIQMETIKKLNKTRQMSILELTGIRIQTHDDTIYITNFEEVFGINDLVEFMLYFTKYKLGGIVT